MPLKRIHVPPRRKRASRGPVYLSALVYPGVGQMVQKRWGAGLTYAALFTVCFLAFLICASIVIVHYYSIAFNFETFKADALPVGPMGVLFFVTLFVYIANLFDTHRAFRRAALAQSREVRERFG
jgi:hypothetical protein